MFRQGRLCVYGTPFPCILRYYHVKRNDAARSVQSGALTPIIFDEESRRSQVTRLNCTAATSATKRPMGSGSTSSWARMAQIQDTGRRVRSSLSRVTKKKPPDDSMWMSAGNGWAAAGMLRVLGTLQSSAFSQDFSNEINDLGNWVAEIHSAMYPYQVRLDRS